VFGPLNACDSLSDRDRPRFAGPRVEHLTLIGGDCIATADRRLVSASLSVPGTQFPLPAIFPVRRGDPDFSHRREKRQDESPHEACRDPLADPLRGDFWPVWRAQEWTCGVPSGRVSPAT
jgi:hypothetical protein